MSKFDTCRADARLQTLSAVLDEIDRQDTLKAQGRFTNTAFDLAHLPWDNLAILVEEVGEVARAINDSQKPLTPTGLEDAEAQLVEELTQVAAVAMAWLEGIHVRRNESK